MGLYVNQELTLLYWDVGRHIRIEVLQEQRADYGEQIVRMLSRSLVAESAVASVERISSTCCASRSCFRIA